MHDNIPGVSIILPTYNRASFLSESIYSVLNQNYPKKELIIINDGSTDNTSKILESFKVYFNVKILKNEINCERAFSRNRAIDICKYDYIALQESDDISIPDRFLRQVAFMEGNNSCGVVGGRIEHIDALGHPIDGWHPPAGYHSGSICRQLMLQGITVVATPTLMFRREVFENYRFEHDYIPAEDWQLLLRISRKWAICNILGKPIVKYRNHSSNSSPKIQQINKHRALLEEIEVSK
jgi:glycosyltransferase involved in cell wall biosynthesis